PDGGAVACRIAAARPAAVAPHRSGDPRRHPAGQRRGRTAARRRARRRGRHRARRRAGVVRGDRTEPGLVSPAGGSAAAGGASGSRSRTGSTHPSSSKQMNLTRAAVLAAMIAACAPAPAARAQPAPASDAAPLVIGETFTIESKILGEMRRINVYAPPAYTLPPDGRLPVLYMPDGGIQEDFVHVAGLVQVSA